MSKSNPIPTTKTEFGKTAAVLGIPFGSVRQTDPSPPVSSPQILKLSGHDPGTLFELLGCGTVPELETFDLASAVLLPSPIILERLLAFLARSACPLREFSLRPAVLRACRPCGPSTCAHFCAADELAALVSHLVRLRILCFPAHVTYDALLAALSSRADGLKGFQLELDSAQAWTCSEQNVLDGFAALARADMNVQTDPPGGASWFPLGL
ncbi:hypothetical protein FB451DRAFT_1166417 [Mycena latifolia]|nr:hypothetical protein FB451DRAFT_1166417 [Mycena latifolia]